MSGVLEGIRVVEVAQGWAGPATTMYLADQGADVIKVEPPGGDLARGWYPSPRLRGTSRSFLAVNRGKRSIALDLTTADARRIAQDLARRADVLVVNLDPARARRLGVDYELLSELNPRLVYAAVSGYGRRGPYAGRPAYDQVIQGLSGAMDRRLPDGTPLRAGVWVADTSAPMLLAYGIALALLGRERSGRGQQVDTSLLEAAVALQVVDLVRVEADPQLPEVSLYSSGVYRGSDDRYLNVAALTERQVVALCTTLGLVDALTDPSFLDDDRDLALFQRRWRAELMAAFATRPAAEWQRLLLGNDVPCGPVLTRDEVFREPQILENEIIVDMDHPEAGPIKVMGIPVHLSANPAGPGMPSPALGEHTDDVLRDLGYDDVQVQELRTRRVGRVTTNPSARGPMASYPFPAGLRVLLAGSSTSRKVRRFARTLGRALITPDAPPRVIVTGGNAGKIEADIIAGVRSDPAAATRGDLSRCVSLLTRQHGPDAVLEAAFEGTVPVVARGGSRQARRFEMVREVDVVVTIGGARSIPTMITLAEALEVPVVPLPFSDGASAEAWDQMKREWLEDDDTASDPVSGTATSRVLQRHQSALDAWDLAMNPDELADEVVRVVDDVGRRTCFVAMPYDEASIARYHPLVARAIDAAGLRMIDGRESLESGLVIEEVKRHIRSSWVVLAVLSDQRRAAASTDAMVVSAMSPAIEDDHSQALPDPEGFRGRVHADVFNPNVMYEVGFAHALGVPTVLMADAEVGLPFDVQAYRAVVIAPDPSSSDDGRDALVARLADQLRHAARL